MPGSFFAWHKLWPVFGLLKLNRFRDRMRRENLHDTETRPSLPQPPLPAPTAEQRDHRTADGAYNDLQQPRMGMAGARFGRNIPLARVDIPSPQSLLTTNPRDRARGVPRYNQFRRLMGMDAVEKFADLSANPKWCEEIRAVYANNLEAVDLQIGMYAEEPIPGFGFSETAFRVFLLMASRRLQSDRFFTTDYHERTYTKTGLQWIEDTTLVTVLRRHLPALQPLLRKQENGFAPWPRGTA